MSASYGQATACQLLQHELQELLLLSAQLSAAYEDDKAAHNTRTVQAHAWTGLRAEQRALATGLLGGAQARSLVTNALLRVHIPRSKQAVLLQGNPFIQDYLQPSAPATNTTSEPATKKESMTHRVGRLVALLPKPEPVAADASTHAASSSARTSAAPELQRWLVAVDFGESVELMALRAVADDVFSEAEHQVYVQSALSSLACSPGTRASSNNNNNSGGGGGLLTSEQAEALRQTLSDVRAALRVVFHGGDVAAAAQSHAALASSGRGDARDSAHVKRPRDAQDGVVVVKQERMEDDDEDEVHNNNNNMGYVATSLASHNAVISTNNNNSEEDDVDGLHARLSRMTEQYNQLNAQLATLRRLLGSRDADLVQQLQQQRQAEARHMAEMERWQGKLREEGAARERLQREMASTTQEQQGLLEQANVKLRRLAEMTMKYKQVVDEVRRQLGGETAHTPEGILAELKKRPISKDAVSVDKGNSHMHEASEDAAAVVLFLFAREKLLFRYPASNPFELGIQQQHAQQQQTAPCMHPVPSFAALPYNHSTLSLSSSDVASNNNNTRTISPARPTATQAEKDEAHATPPLPPASTSSATSQNTSFAGTAPAPPLPPSHAAATPATTAGPTAHGNSARIGVPPQRPLLLRRTAAGAAQAAHSTHNANSNTNSVVSSPHDKPAGRSTLSRHAKHSQASCEAADSKAKAAAGQQQQQQQQQQAVHRGVASPTNNHTTATGTTSNNAVVSSSSVAAAASCGTDSCVGIPTSVFMHLLRATPSLCTTLHIASVTFLIYRIVLAGADRARERRAPHKPHGSSDDEEDDEDASEEGDAATTASQARTTLSRRTRRRRTRTMTAMLVVAMRRPDTNGSTVARFVQCFVNVLSREERRAHYVTAQLELMERLSIEHASRNNNHNNNATNNSGLTASGHHAGLTDREMGRGSSSNNNNNSHYVRSVAQTQGAMHSRPDSEDEGEEEEDEEGDDDDDENEEGDAWWQGRSSRRVRQSTSDASQRAAQDTTEGSAAAAEMMRHDCVFTFLAHHPRATLCAEMRQLTECIELWSRRRAEVRSNETEEADGCTLGSPAMLLTPAGAVWADNVPKSNNNNNNSSGVSSSDSICINAFLQLPLRLLTGTATPCARRALSATQFHPCSVVRLCDASFPARLQADYISEVGQDYAALLPLSTVLGCLRGLRVPWRMGAFYRSLSWALLVALAARLSQSTTANNNNATITNNTSNTSSNASARQSTALRQSASTTLVESAARRSSAIATASATARATVGSVTSSHNGNSVPNARLSPFLRSSMPASTTTALPLPSPLTTAHGERRERGGAENNTTAAAAVVAMAQALRQVAGMSFLTLAVLQLLCRHKVITTDSTIGIWFTHGEILPPPQTAAAGRKECAAVRQATRHVCTSEDETSDEDDNVSSASPHAHTNAISAAATMSTLSVLYMLQRLAELPAHIAPMAGQALGSSEPPLHLALATDLSSSGYTNAIASVAVTPSPAPTTTTTTTMVPLQTVPPTPSPANMGSTFAATIPFAVGNSSNTATMMMSSAAQHHNALVGAAMLSATGSNALYPGSPCTPLSGSTERTSRTPLTNTVLARATTGIFAATTTGASVTMPQALLPPAAASAQQGQPPPMSRSWQQLQLLRKRRSAGQVCHTPLSQASQPPSSQAISAAEDIVQGGGGGARREESSSGGGHKPSPPAWQRPSFQVCCAWGAACPLCEALASHPAYWMLPHGSGQVPVVLDFPALDSAVRRWAGQVSPMMNDGPLAMTASSRGVGSNGGGMSAVFDEAHMQAGQQALRAAGPLFDGVNGSSSGMMMMMGAGEDGSTLGGAGGVGSVGGTSSVMAFAHSLEQRPWFLRPEIYMTPDARYDDSPLMVHKRQLMRHEAAVSSSSISAHASAVPDSPTSPTRVPSVASTSLTNSSAARKAHARNASPRHKATPLRTRPQGKCANVVDQSHQDAHVLLCVGNVPAEAARWLRRAAGRIHARLHHARITADAMAALAATALHTATCAATQPAAHTGSTDNAVQLSKPAGAAGMAASAAVPVHSSARTAATITTAPGLPPQHNKNNNNNNNNITGTDETLAASARSSLFQSLDAHPHAAPSDTLLHRAEATRQVVGSVGSPTRPRSVRYSKRLLPDRSANLRLLPTVVVSALHETASPELTRSRTQAEVQASDETPGGDPGARAMGEQPQSPTALSSLWLGPAQRSIPAELLLQFAFHHLVVLLWGRQGGDMEVVLRQLERNLRRLQPFLQYLPYLKQLVAAGYTSEAAVTATSAAPHTDNSADRAEGEVAAAPQPQQQAAADAATCTRRQSSTAAMASVTPASATMRLSARDVQLLQTYELYDQLALLDYLLPYAHYKVDVVPATLLLHAMVNEFSEVLFVAAVADDALQH